MENLILPNAKMLFLVTELWRENTITEAEKIYAKGNSIFPFFVYKPH